MKTNSRNTAIVEKIWKIDSKDFMFDPDKFNYVLVRPCNVTYQTYKNFLLGKKTKCKMIVHEGAVMSWHRDKSLGWTHEPETFEEMLIKAELDCNVMPEFENWMFDFNWKTYTVRTIDMRTHKVLYDHLDKWLSENTRRGLI